MEARDIDNISEGDVKIRQLKCRVRLYLYAYGPTLVGHEGVPAGGLYSYRCDSDHIKE